VVRTVLDDKQLREHASRQLPDYMVPAYWIGMPALPMNVNGKLDICALPLVETGAAKPALPAISEGSATPLTP